MQHLVTVLALTLPACGGDPGPTPAELEAVCAKTATKLCAKACECDSSGSCAYRSLSASSGWGDSRAFLQSQIDWCETTARHGLCGTMALSLDELERCYVEIGAAQCRPADGGASMFPLAVPSECYPE